MTSDQHNALTMRNNGFSWADIADELDTTIPKAKLLHAEARLLGFPELPAMRRPKPYEAWPPGCCGGGGMQRTGKRPRPRSAET